MTRRNGKEEFDVAVLRQATREMEELVGFSVYLTLDGKQYLAERDGEDLFECDSNHYELWMRLVNQRIIYLSDISPRAAQGRKL